MRPHFLAFVVLIFSWKRVNCASLGRNHTVISICGWPQSGTSLVHEIVERLSGTSTMIKKCTNINTERNCIGFNYESQWLLKNRDKHQLFSGAMCPLSSSDVTAISKKSMVARWTSLWDMDKPYLISKSPANMMKIPYVHETFSEASAVRHIVVIKVTWEMVLMSYNPSNPEKPRAVQPGVNFKGNHAKRLHMATVSNSLGTFLHMLRNNNNSTRCEVGNEGGGWLSSMEYLATWLHMNKDFAHQNVRILRFEDFLESPFMTCYNLASYVYHGHTAKGDASHKLAPDKLATVNKLDSDTIFEQCRNLFKFDKSERMRSMDKRRTPRTGKSSHFAESYIPGSSRRLRMHMNEDGTRAKEWKFSYYGAMKSCAPRVANFKKVLQLARNKNYHVAEELLHLDASMRKFGYSIGHNDPYPYSSRPTVLDDWDLMYDGKSRRKSPQTTASIGRKKGYTI